MCRGNSLGLCSLPALRSPRRRTALLVVGSRLRRSHCHTYTLGRYSMAIDEIERTEMVRKLIDTLGETPAATLMKCVYPNGTGFLATKDDLTASEERMRSYVDSALARQTRMFMVTMASFMLTIWVPLIITALT